MTTITVKDRPLGKRAYGFEGIKYIFVYIFKLDYYGQARFVQQ